MRRAAWCLALVGCFSKPPAPVASDGSIGSRNDAGDAMGDAHPLGPSCAGIPFMANPEVHSELGAFFAADATLTADLREVYFSTDPGAGGAIPYIYDIARAIRSSASGSFGITVEPLPFNDANSADTDPSLTADGRMIVFVSLRSGDARLWSATRNSAGTWSTASMVPGLTSVDITSADVSPDGLEIYFARSGAPSELSRAVRPDLQSAFVVDSLVLGIDCLFPSVGSQGRELFFNDENDSHVGYATRTHTTEPFGAPIALLTGYVDADVSADGEAIVATQGGSFVIARRNCP